jgi:hypothetical protein
VIRQKAVATTCAYALATSSEPSAVRAMATAHFIEARGVVESGIRLLPLGARKFAQRNLCASADGRQKVWRTSTHPVRSRIQSQGVVRCHSVFRMGWVISPRRNPAYRRSRPTFCSPKTARSGRQIAVFASDLAAARRLADSIQRAAATVSRWPTFCAPTLCLTTHGPGP